MVVASQEVDLGFLPKPRNIRQWSASYHWADGIPIGKICGLFSIRGILEVAFIANFRLYLV